MVRAAHRRALILDEPFGLTATFDDLQRPWTTVQGAALWDQFQAGHTRHGQVKGELKDSVRAGLPGAWDTSSSGV